QRPMSTKTPPTSSPKDRNCFNVTRSCIGLPLLIQLKFLSPVGVRLQPFLIRLVENAVLQHKDVHFSAHEAPIGVFRCAYDRLSANIKRGVNNDTTAGLRFKSLNQPIVALICL